ncbi:hypothetical protein GQX73_g4090 [Xylaria multiplex]|uniref:DUF7600 domain-containing protein n=1 Tax=Xylaria multiplex TaxID=323545 RepID=A0A7C8IQ59_9PEZI|nr:hypothetical protein GQX73_g4090 [Xylaria multiplex]
MSDYLYFKENSCVFCGTRVYEPWESWKNDFRGIRSEPEGIVITHSIYCTLYGHWHGPVDSSRSSYHGPPSQALFGADSQPEFNDLRDFIFHDACWRLLEASLSASAVPATLGRIFEVIQSLPFPSRESLNGWGHRLGDPAVAKGDFLPWEDKVKDAPVCSLVTCHDANPYDDHETNRILSEIPQLPPDAPLTGPNIETKGVGINTLPYELCLAIAIILPTREVFNARLASRAFLPIFYDQLFWQSRFKAPFERAWFFDARKHRGDIDWRSLYRRTHFDQTNVDQRPTLRNRQRVWNLLDTLMDALNSRWHDTIMSFSPLTPDSPHSLEVVGDLLGKAGRTHNGERRGRFEKGCRLWHKFHIAIPNNLSQFSVAYIQAPDAGYISGIKFTTTTGDIIQLGYWSFVLAVSCRGIRAVQCLTSGETTSRWLGCPDNCPITRRLAVFDSQLDSLEVGFDGFKIVCLASTKPRQQISQKDTLRFLGLWYPDIPDPSLSLNESPGDWWDSFDIDGPGGEIINGIKLCLNDNYSLHETLAMGFEDLILLGYLLIEQGREHYLSITTTFPA